MKIQTEKSWMIQQVKANFDIRELVDPFTYNRWGEKSWMFLQKDLLNVIRVLRNEVLKVPMIVNTWASGGDFDERGLRSNLCDLVKSKTQKETLYLSPHMMGAAIDFHTKEYTAEQIREKIKEYWGFYSDFPAIRLEKDVTWVHIDVFDDGKGNYVTEFNG